MSELYELRHSVVSLVLPNRCPFCDRVVGMREYWCGACYESLPFVNKPIEAPENVDAVIACCYYTRSARSAILRMKDGGYIYSCEAFAVMMTEAVGDLMESVDCVAAVPSTMRRRYELGYAQAEVIAKNIAWRGGRPFRRLLKAKGAKKEQKRLNRQERAENARNAFKAVNEKYIIGKTILLVDDVSTTGATFSAIAGLLKQAGAKTVYAVAFAKTE